MRRPASSTHFLWSLKLNAFVIVNVLDAFDESLQGYHRLNNCY